MEGGEEGFIYKMMLESIDYRKQIRLFTTLIGRKINLKDLKDRLQDIKSMINQGEPDSLCEIKIWDTTFYQGKTARYTEFTEINKLITNRWGLAWMFIENGRDKSA